MIYLFSFNHGLNAYPIAQQKENTTIRYWHYFYKNIRGKHYVYFVNTQLNSEPCFKLEIINDEQIDYVCKLESLEYVLPNILIEEEFDFYNCGGNQHLCSLVQKHLFRIISDSI